MKFVFFLVILLIGGFFFFRHVSIDQVKQAGSSVLGKKPQEKPKPVEVKPVDEYEIAAEKAAKTGFPYDWKSFIKWYYKDIDKQQVKELNDLCVKLSKQFKPHISKRNGRVYHSAYPVPESLFFLTPQESKLVYENYEVNELIATRLLNIVSTDPAFRACVDPQVSPMQQHLEYPQILSNIMTVYHAKIFKDIDNNRIDTALRDMRLLGSFANGLNSSCIASIHFTRLLDRRLDMVSKMLDAKLTDQQYTALETLLHQEEKYLRDVFFKAAIAELIVIAEFPSFVASNRKGASKIIAMLGDEDSLRPAADYNPANIKKHRIAVCEVLPHIVEKFTDTTADNPVLDDDAISRLNLSMDHTVLRRLLNLRTKALTKVRLAQAALALKKSGDISGIIDPYTGSEFMQYSGNYIFKCRKKFLRVFGMRIYSPGPDGAFGSPKTDRDNINFNFNMRASDK